MTYLYLALAGFGAWIVSTVGGGGGALVLVPVVSFLVGVSAVAPVVTLTTMIAEPTRIDLFRKSIDWSIVRWYLPGALVGAVAGAWLFARTEVEWLQLVIGLFLVTTVFQYRFGKRERTFRVHLWHFLPAGLGVSFVSGLVGTMSANWLGKRLLGEMSPKRFRQAVITVMVVSGVVMLWGQREVVSGILGG